MFHMLYGILEVFPPNIRLLIIGAVAVFTVLLVVYLIRLILDLIPFV